VGVRVDVWALYLDNLSCNGFEELARGGDTPCASSSGRGPISLLSFRRESRTSAAPVIDDERQTAST
jgi:hypothetical protein